MGVLELGRAILSKAAKPDVLESASRVPGLDDNCVLGYLQPVEHGEVVIEYDDVGLGDQPNTTQNLTFGEGCWDAEGLVNLELESPLLDLVVDRKKVSTHLTPCFGGEEET